MSSAEKGRLVSEERYSWVRLDWEYCSKSNWISVIISPTLMAWQGQQQETPLVGCDINVGTIWNDDFQLNKLNWVSSPFYCNMHDWCVSLLPGVRKQKSQHWCQIIWTTWIKSNLKHVLPSVLLISTFKDFISTSSSNAQNDASDAHTLYFSVMLQ